MKNEETILVCPLCQSSLAIEQGDGMNPKNGIMVSCPKVGCIDSGGHGDNAAKAFQVFLDKCGRAYGATK